MTPEEALEREMSELSNNMPVTTASRGATPPSLLTPALEDWHTGGSIRGTGRASPALNMMQPVLAQHNNLMISGSTSSWDSSETAKRKEKL
jgi:hypothetical protein